MTELTLTGALIVGLLGSSHCLAMCGGLSSMLGVQADASNRSRLISYNIGRLSSYTAIGAIAGLFGEQVVTVAPQLAATLRLIAGLLLVAMGLYVSRWWMGLSYLEKGGALLWRYIQPLVSGLLPINNHWQALLLGTMWGFLPCGLVYSTLSLALATAQWQQSALFMLAFGIGTLPAMLATGFAGEKLLMILKERKFRVIAGVVIILMGLITLWMPLSHQLSIHSGVETHRQMNH